MSGWRASLGAVWGLWGVVCLVSLGLEVQSPFYADGLAWVYWGSEAEVGWRNSSLLRWVLYHLFLFGAPGVGYAILRRFTGRRETS